MTGGKSADGPHRRRRS